MPRTERVIVPGMPHHITQRGTRRFDVFRDDADRLEYIELFSNCCREFHLAILAYCLMTNHVHFVAIPERADSVHRVFHRVHGPYARRFNIKYGLVGHLWQERPNSYVLDEAHLWNAIRYVERNPVRAGMVANAADYRWSSAAAHCHSQHDPLLTSIPAFANLEPDWADGGTIREYSRLRSTMRNTRLKNTISSNSSCRKSPILRVVGSQLWFQK